jgi:hypothetical protein
MRIDIDSRLTSIKAIFISGVNRLAEIEKDLKKLIIAVDVSYTYRPEKPKQNIFVKNRFPFTYFPSTKCNIIITNNKLFLL